MIMVKDIGSDPLSITDNPIPCTTIITTYTIPDGNKIKLLHTSRLIFSCQYSNFQIPQLLFSTTKILKYSNLMVHGERYKHVWIGWGYVAQNLKVDPYKHFIFKEIWTQY